MYGAHRDLHSFPTRRSSDLRVSYKVQRTINASLNAATSTRAVSSNPNFEACVYGTLEDRKSGSAGMPRPTSYAVFCLKKKNQTTRNDSRSNHEADATV